MKEEKTYRVILSGGGTGGHIYPAVAVANKLRDKLKGVDILFVGASGKMEMQKVPEAGYKIKGLNINGLRRSLSFKNLAFPFKVISSIAGAFKILKDFKPDVAVGFGGYASAPVLYAATRKKIPTIIQEQNSFAGITNKMLGKRVDKVCVAHDRMDRFFPAEKIKITGNPVRETINQVEEKRREGLSYFGLKEDKPIVLALGGSLGARTMNESIMAELDTLKEANVQLVWQCGKFYLNEMLERAQDKLGNGLLLTEFISDMDIAYAIADVVISRAGALSVSELCLVGKPVIFVPSPNVAEDHQTKNAMALVEKDAAWMVTDAEAKKTLVRKCLQLLADGEAKAKLSRNIKLLAKPHATEDIANEIISMIK